MLLVLLADLRNLATLDRDLDRYTLVGGALDLPVRVEPAARRRTTPGLGGVITTVAIREEPALQASCSRSPSRRRRRRARARVPGGQAGDEAAAQPGGVVRDRRPLRRRPRSRELPTRGGAPPCRIANQASGDSLHARHAALISSSSARVAKPAVDGLIGERRGDHAVGPHAAPPGPVLGRGEAPHRRGRATLGEAGGPRPRRAGDGRHRARRRCAARRSWYSSIQRVEARVRRDTR